MNPYNKYEMNKG